MDILPKKSALKCRARQVLPVLAVAAVILAFLGPAMDHHYAERQHNHAHLYLTSVSASHGHPGFHPFEQFHPHNDSSRFGHGQDGVLYQTSGDGTSDSGSQLGGALINGGRTYHLGGGDPLSPAFPSGNGLYLEIFVSPPEKPPRA